MNIPNEIRVAAATVDKKFAILYLEDGQQLTINNGDHRLGDLLKVIIPIVTREEIAIINLEEFSVYSAFEKKSENKVKFFRVLKEKVTGWFGGKTDTHEKVMVSIPEQGKQAVLQALKGETMTEETVMEHGQQINFNDEVDTEKEVIVAVVEDPVTQEKKVIPGVHSIKPLIDHAVRSSSTKAVERFLARCAGFIDKRPHSTDDLMRFLEKGDLPLAEDGCIIAYKVLRSFGNGVFVDCHSGNIKQRVGSYVCVNEDLVDLNRRTECSNGLHIARRGYLRGFSGDVLVLCKIDPEDVMVVPHNDPNKVRVKGYHILGKLSNEAWELLKQNKPMTGEEDALQIVYNAIKGNHIDRIERVQVNGQMGTNVVITKLEHDEQRGKQNYDATGAELKTAAALDDHVEGLGNINPRDVNQQIAAEYDKIRGNDGQVILTDNGDNDMGTEPEEDDEDDEDPNPDAGVTGTLSGEGTVREDARVTEEVMAMTPEDKQALNEMAPKIIDRLAHKELADKTMGKSAIADLLLDYNTAPEGNAKVDAARAIVAFKKQKKKGWSKLGIDSPIAAEIEKDAQLEAGPLAGTKEENITRPLIGEDLPKATSTIDFRNAVATHMTPDKDDPIVAHNAKKEEPVTPSTGSLTVSDRAREMYNRGLHADVYAFARSKKKSLAALGFSDKEIEKIKGK